MTTVFNHVPVINGETMFLRPLLNNDFDGLFACAGDKKAWAGHPDSERYKRENFKRFYFDGTPNDGVSIGYTFLAYRCWGGAVNRELKLIMLNYAFKTFNAVWFHVSPLNKRSQAALLKIGAEHIKDEVVSLGGKA